MNNWWNFSICLANFVETIVDKLVELHDVVAQVENVVTSVLDTNNQETETTTTSTVAPNSIPATATALQPQDTVTGMGTDSYYAEHACSPDVYSQNSW